MGGQHFPGATRVGSGRLRGGRLGKGRALPTPRAGLSSCLLSSDDLDPEELQLEMEEPRPQPAVQCSPAPGERAPLVGRAGTGEGLLQKVRSRCSKVSTRGARLGERKVYFGGWQPGWLGDGRLVSKA